MAYWLIKSEPDVFSIDDLERDEKSPWEGVRNYQARNNLRAMKAGDEAFFYHSSTGRPSIVGRARVVREAYPEPEDDRWSRVDVEFVEKFARPLALEDARKQKALAKMVLLNNTRLSVQPVTPAEWKLVLKLAA